MVSGVGTVTFANPAARATSATFSAAGTYTLRLTASDSALSASDTVVVIVNPAPVNQPPVVNAGPESDDHAAGHGELVGTATDERPTQPAREPDHDLVEGQRSGTVTFGNASARATTATFSLAGSYTLRLTASDSALSTLDDIVITVNAVVNQPPVANAGPGSDDHVAGHGEPVRDRHRRRSPQPARDRDHDLVEGQRSGDRDVRECERARDDGDVLGGRKLHAAPDRERQRPVQQ